MTDSDRHDMLADIRSSLEIASDIPQAVGGDEQPLEGALAAELFEDFQTMQDRFAEELADVSASFDVLEDQAAAAKWAGEVLAVDGFSTLVVAEEGLCLDIATAIQADRPDLDVVVAKNLEGAARQDRLAQSTAALVEVDYALADIGSLIVLRDNTASMLPHFLPESVMAIVRPGQLLPNQFELIKVLPQDAGRNMVFITGPSRTADVEKVLILGAHGPRRVSVGMLA